MADALDLLPGAAAPFEIALLEALLASMPIDAAAASTVWDPWTCPAHLLPQLAYALSVDLWYDDWPELKKRSVIAASPELHDLKTSIEGYRRYLAIVDCRLVDYVAPPKGFVAGETQTDEERRAWLRGLPELRLYTGVEFGAFDGGLYADLGFADLDPALDDRGRQLAARKARLFDPQTGTFTQIGPVDFDRLEAGETTVAVERIALPGPFDPLALYADLAFADAACAVPEYPAAAPVFTWRTDTTGAVAAGALLDALPNGLKAVDAAPERVPLRRLLDLGFYADVSCADRAFAGEETAALGYYDVYKLARVGQKSGTALFEAGGYADIDYVGWPTHTLHLLVDAGGPADLAALYADVGFADRACAIDDDLTRFDQALRAAYVASGPGSDHVTLSAETTRFLTLSDGIPLDGSFRFGQRVPRAGA